MSHIVAPDLHNSESYLTVIIYPGEGGEQQLSYNATGGGADVRIWIDLTTDVPGLAFGDIYNLDLQFTSEGGEGPPDYELYAIYETPYTEETFDEPQAPGYAVPAEWEHGDYVYGSTSSPKVQETTANLEALDDIVQAVNFACPERYEGAVAGFLFGVRHRRWLHYLSNSYWDDEEGDTIIEDGVLAYELRGAETTVTLPASPTVDTWMAVDLDSVDGLWPGTHYWIGGVRYAIEDIEY